MNNTTKVDLRLIDGEKLQIQVSDYEGFVESVRFRDASTVIVDLVTELNIFALSIATFKKVK
jgi:hypothetical protein